MRTQTFSITLLLNLLSFFVSYAGTPATCTAQQNIHSTHSALVPAPLKQVNHRATFSPTYGTMLDFGDVPMGDSVQKTFSYSNTGDDTLFIRSLELTPEESDFTIQFARLTLAPHTKGTVIVQFAPKSLGTDSGTLSFVVANGVSSPIVTLGGNAIQTDDSALSSVSLGKMRGGINRMNDSH